MTGTVENQKKEIQLILRREGGEGRRDGGEKSSGEEEETNRIESQIWMLLGWVGKLRGRETKQAGESGSMVRTRKRRKERKEGREEVARSIFVSLSLFFAVDEGLTNRVRLGVLSHLKFESRELKERRWEVDVVGRTEGREAESSS